MWNWSSLKEKQSQVSVAHTFNPCIWESHTLNPGTKEVEKGRDMVGWREEYKVTRDRSSWQCSLRHSQCTAVSLWWQSDKEFWGQDHHFGLRISRGKSSSGWLLSFSDSSAFTPVVDSELLLKPIRIHATERDTLWHTKWEIQRENERETYIR